MFSIVFFVIAVFFALGRIYFAGAGVIEAFLFSMIVICVGASGIFAFLGHMFNGDKVADGIGWPKGNLFQKEVAFANLGVGTLGILSIWLHGNFWIAPVVASSIFGFGAAGVHIYDMAKSGNKNKYNAGPVLWFGDIIKPMLLIGLLAAYLLS